MKITRFINHFESKSLLSPVIRCCQSSSQMLFKTDSILVFFFSSAHRKAVFPSASIAFKSARPLTVVLLFHCSLLAASSCVLKEFCHNKENLLLRFGNLHLHHALEEFWWYLEHAHLPNGAAFHLSS